MEQKCSATKVIKLLLSNMLKNLNLKKFSWMNQNFSFADIFLSLALVMFFFLYGASSSSKNSLTTFSSSSLSYSFMTVINVIIGHIFIINIGIFVSYSLFINTDLCLVDWQAQPHWFLIGSYDLFQHWLALYPMNS